MVDVSYIRKKEVYRVTSCTVDDIEAHYQKVIGLIEPEGHLSYKANMYHSVLNGTSLKVEKNGTVESFIYTYVDAGVGYATCILGSAVSFIPLFRVLFTNYPSHKILFSHHFGDVGYIKSMCTGVSIRQAHEFCTPLVVLLRDIFPKYKTVFLRMGFTPNV